MERVTQVSVPPTRSRTRIAAMLSRYPGDRLEARDVTRSDQDAVFALMSRVKGRFGISRVTSHVCRHDEDIGHCTPDREA